MSEAVAGQNALAIAEERGLAAFDDNTANPFETYAGDKGVSNGVLMRFNGNSGEFSANQQPIEHNTVLAFDIFNAERGYVLWKNKKPVEHIMTRFVGGAPIPKWSELKHVTEAEKIAETDGWTEVVRIPVMDPAGGPMMDLSLPSGESWRPVNRLLKEYGGKVRMYKDPEGGYKIPLIEISARSFESTKAIGKKFAPVLTIVDWLSRAEMDEISASNEEATKDGEATAVAAAPAAALAPPPAAPAPVAAPVAQQTAAAPVAAAAQTAPTAPGVGGYRRGRVGQRA